MGRESNGVVISTFGDLEMVRSKSSAEKTGFPSEIAL